MVQALGKAGDLDAAINNPTRPDGIAALSMQTPGSTTGLLPELTPNITLEPSLDDPLNSMTDSNLYDTFAWFDPLSYFLDGDSYLQPCFTNADTPRVV